MSVKQIDTICSFSAWLATLSIPTCRQNFVEKFLDIDDNGTPNEVHDFVENFLRPDGNSLFILISHDLNSRCFSSKNDFDACWKCNVCSTYRTALASTFPTISSKAVVRLGTTQRF